MYAVGEKRAILVLRHFPNWCGLLKFVEGGFYFHPSDEDMSPGGPDNHPSDEDPSFTPASKVRLPGTPNAAGGPGGKNRLE